ncbi:hypothetical protein C8R45DRAFT_933507 [Mycena sanguinolenta]|nr:hypothetical protein C8R45DRAFT_933507 [Mycena sanguinolenta]
MNLWWMLAWLLFTVLPQLRMPDQRRISARAFLEFDVRVGAHRSAPENLPLFQPAYSRCSGSKATNHCLAWERGFLDASIAAGRSVAFSELNGTDLLATKYGHLICRSDLASKARLAGVIIA